MDGDRFGELDAGDQGEGERLSMFGILDRRGVEELAVLVSDRSFEFLLLGGDLTEQIV